MADTTEVAARGDYSIAELRGLMNGETPADKPADDASDAAPAEGDEQTPTETDRESGTDEGSQEDADKKPARGEDGKFKPAEEGNVQKRISKAVKAQREAERRAEDAERRLAALQGPQPATGDTAGKPAQQQPADAKGKPELKDFETYEAFNEALVEWKVEQREIAREQKQRETAAKAAVDATQKAHAERVEAFKVEHEDFDEKISVLQPYRISAELIAAIRESEYGPQVVYHLADDPAAAERISKLSPVKQVAEFGKLEAKFEAKPATAKTTPARKPLPKPAANVGGGSTSAGKEIDLADPRLPMSTFKRELNRRMTRA